jgi:hypothetical protein
MTTPPITRPIRYPITLPIMPLAAAVERLDACSLIDAEFMHQPRPTAQRERLVFDFALNTRLTELSRHDNAAVLLLCRDQHTAASVAHLPAAYPRLTLVAVTAAPTPISAAATESDARTPYHCAWDAPERWQRYAQTDRWARIIAALTIASRLPRPGHLIMPAHDAVWGRGLLAHLLRLSGRYAQAGLPAAVSPYTYHQQSRVPGVDIPRDIIAALNAAFAHDSWLWLRLRRGRYQAFWGKMGLLPFGMCASVLARAEPLVWEDDLEIDSAIRAAGWGACCRWIANPAHYRQALPVFDRAGLRKVVERTLHYSLNLPGAYYGAHSVLNQPLDQVGRWRRLDPRFDRAVRLSDAIIAEVNAEIAERIGRYGCSWVDWGGYRYVVRVGDPFVQVWGAAPSADMPNGT